MSFAFLLIVESKPAEGCQSWILVSLGIIHGHLIFSLFFFFSGAFFFSGQNRRIIVTYSDLRLFIVLAAGVVWGITLRGMHSANCLCRMLGRAKSVISFISYSSWGDFNYSEVIYGHFTNPGN